MVGHEAGATAVNKITNELLDTKGIRLSIARLVCRAHRGQRLP